MCVVRHARALLLAGWLPALRVRTVLFREVWRILRPSPFFASSNFQPANRRLMLWSTLCCSCTLLERHYLSYFLNMLASSSRRLASSHVRRVLQTSQAVQVRSFSPSATRFDDLPYHMVVGMPALSPTMETGVLAEWYIPEGSSFIAGQALAKIETDKASMDFEAQDDGFIAKILYEAGTGADIVVGTPIMVTVEEEDDVAAFANFEAPAVAAAPAPEPVAPKVVEAAAPAPAPVAAPPAPVAPTPEPVVAAAVVPPAMEDMVAAVAPVMSTGWGDFAKLNSPLIKTLSKQQNDYVSKYGTTGQVPL